LWQPFTAHHPELSQSSPDNQLLAQEDRYLLLVRAAEVTFAVSILAKLLQHLTQLMLMLMLMLLLLLPVLGGMLFHQPYTPCMCDKPYVCACRHCSRIQPLQDVQLLHLFRLASNLPALQPTGQQQAVLLNAL
jgi:hypothetical protein